MTETGLFVAGGIVTFIVFTGGFLYTMLTFGRWVERDQAKLPAPIET
jgi:hypothetical protein